MKSTRTRNPKLWCSSTLLCACLVAGPNLWGQTQEDFSEDDIYVLSPFEIQTSEADIGYFTENTTAGSRLNTKLSDLAASITVVSRQQLDDTASVDLNDVFRYELNTEGSSTYTPSVQSLRNDGVVDTIAGFTHGGSGSPQTSVTANRVRGIGAPDRTVNYYLSVPNLPFDAYNVQSLEINRGPNSMIFGLGSPAGIVNVSTASAFLGKDATSLSLRFDDRGSYRSSISFNRPLHEKVAIYGAFLHNNQQFERKPSYDKTTRAYGAITIQPTKSSRLRFNIEHYDNENRRPNNLTPRDGVTHWRNAGMPSYDPTTLEVTLMSTGQNMGPYIRNAASPQMDRVRDWITAQPGYDASLWNAAQTTYAGYAIAGGGSLTNASSSRFVPGITFANEGRPTMQIANGQVQNWFTGFAGQYRDTYGTAANPAANAALVPSTADIYANPASDQVFNQMWTTSALLPAPAGIGSYRYPGVTDKSIYNWKKVNVNQMNFGKDKALTYNAEYDHELIKNLLNINAGYFHQDFKSTTNYTVAQLNVTTLWVDTNVRLPDGRLNPYFGLPYVEDFDPDQFYNRTTNDHYRAMIAFTPDFTGKDGILGWLGRHQLVGMASRFDSMHEFERRRWNFTAGDEVANGTIRWLKNPNNDASGNPTGWNYENTSIRRTFYLAQPGDPFGTVTRGSGEWNHSTYTGGVQTYNYGSNQWEDVSMTQGYNLHSASTNRNQRRIDTLKAGLTSYLWDDRIVTTFGVSKDKYKARAITTGTITNADGTVTPGLTNPERWVDGNYQWDSIRNRWNVWDELEGTTTTMGGVFFPFKNWRSIEDRASSGDFFGQLLQGMGFHFNKSDNFNPPSAAQVDGFGNPLPKPSGEGKDYGVQVTLFDGKLYARLTRFEATNDNERTNPGTSISRLVNNVDETLFRNWARTIALINTGRNPTTDGWDEVPAAEEAAIQAATAVIWGQEHDYYGNLPGTIYATRSAEAEGFEFQVVYNPMRNWTMKFTASQQETKYSNVLKEFDAWSAHRSPVWDGARAADYLLPQYQQFTSYTMFSGREVDLTSFWGSYGYRPEIRLDEPNNYFNAQLYYDGVVTPQYAIARDLEGQVAPGQRKNRWNILTNYAFEEGKLQGFNVGGAIRWEDEAIIGYYGKANPGSGSDNLVLSDVSRPIYDKAQTYTDLWVGYRTKVWKDKVNMKLQLNIVNAFESGELRVVGVNFDGSPNAYRIIDPRQFMLTATFDF
jgi:hypothetical protein